MKAPARDWQRLGCAAVLGAIIAFPAGMALSGREPVEPEASKTTSAPVRNERVARNPYSPNVLSDPYVLQQHQAIAEALEMSCRETGEGCAEAKQARRYLSEREAARTR